MSYQLVELLQLAFALGLIFTAFLGGLAIGWWRWGRDESSRRDGAETSVSTTVSAELFTPAEPGRDEVVLNQPVFEADTGPKRQLPAPAEPFA